MSWVKCAALAVTCLGAGRHQKDMRFPCLNLGDNDEEQRTIVQSLHNSTMRQIGWISEGDAHSGLA